jgi:hypothetical protein
MRVRLFILMGLVVTAAFFHCKKEETPVPACIQQKMDSIKQRPQSTPPVQLHAWDYNGRRVYLFTAPDTNALVKVFDENCQYVCAPSGGPAGYGDSLCADFYQAAIHISLIWKDDR